MAPTDAKKRRTTSAENGKPGQSTAPLRDRPGFERKREKRHQNRPFPHMTLAAAIKKALSAPVIKRRLDALPIAQEWEALVGESIARHIQPIALDKGVLTLEADSSVWRHQISLEKEALRQKIAAKFDREHINEIRIK